MMADLATLELRLAEAELAKHKLALGEKVVLLSYSAEGTNTRQFNQASLPLLNTYISELKAEITRAKGGRGRGPIYFG
ncbi:gpW family head-tail joining protein [Tianweitania sediminis]|uniref:GpW n=1 Tax=Tianweitania sediminis TaxID=1502156 RepID=A0A8J7R0T9_9HYPH|nr:gpW family head-tail joining protein [Tianweitania sediminis]MBP0439910.1 hypothetical protein [Tianweitania sediminis]